MDKELIEKLSAIRESLEFIRTLAENKKNLAEVVRHGPDEQKSKLVLAIGLGPVVESYLQDKDHLADAVTNFVPRMLADLDDIEKRLQSQQQ